MVLKLLILVYAVICLFLLYVVHQERRHSPYSGEFIDKNIESCRNNIKKAHEEEDYQKMYFYMDSLDFWIDQKEKYYKQRELPLS